MFDRIVSTIAENKKAVGILALGMLSCVYLALCAFHIYSALALVAAGIAFYAFYRSPDAAFAAYLLLLPFGYAPVFERLPMGINAGKLLLLLSCAVLVLFVLYKKPHEISPAFTVLFIVLVVLFCISWLRSMEYTRLLFSENAAGKLPIHRFLPDYVSWTFTCFLPLLLIAYYYGSEGGILKILKAVAFSAMLLFGSLVLVYLFQVPDKSDFEVIRAELSAYSGLHGNDLANFGILSFPLILSWALSQRSKLAYFTLFLVGAGTAVCFSRTAYFLVLFGIFLLLYLCGMRRWIPVAAIVIGIGLYVLAPDMVVDRAMTGLNTGDYDEISAGRTDQIWQPILQELGSKPGILLFGSGRYGLTNLEVWKQGVVPPVLHAHNMYLDCILDAGIPGLLLFLAFFALLLVRFGKQAGRCRKTSPFYANLLFGCMVSVICYLISGFTGRSFFPAVGNSYLWIVIGLGIAVSRAAQARDPQEKELQKRAVQERGIAGRDAQGREAAGDGKACVHHG
jgi:O-antigen ligase